MRKKRSKKRSKWRFLRNLRKYRFDFLKNGVKTMATALAPTSAIFYVSATIPKGGAGAKKRSKLLRNLRKYRTDLKNNGVKIIQRLYNI